MLAIPEKIREWGPIFKGMFTGGIFGGICAASILQGTDLCDNRLKKVRDAIVVVAIHGGAFGGGTSRIPSDWSPTNQQLARHIIRIASTVAFCTSLATITATVVDP